MGLQILILLTGNYTFFNFLTLALCLLLLDDFVLQRIVPSKCPAFVRRSTVNLQPSDVFRRWPKAVTIPLAVVVIAVSLFQMASMFGLRFGSLAAGGISER